MSESTEVPAAIKSSMKRRDFLKASVASSVLALCPTSALASTLGIPENFGKTPIKLIDIHAHIVSADTRRYPIAPLEGERSGWSKERPVDFEAMTAAMNEAGIGKAALVQAATAYGYDCSYLADSVARAPHRFVGVFSVDMMAPDAPDKIRYWATQKKLGGLRTFARANSKQPMQLTVPTALAGLESAQVLELPVVVSLQMATLPELHVVVKQFPKIRFIMDHMIEPPIAEGPPYTGSQYLFELAQYPNVYLKLTSRNIRASRTGKGSPETFFPLLVSKFGASRIAWGSNYPSSEGTLKELVLDAQSALAVLSAQDREWIFARTAQSLYPALADK